jgi:hypothetical protein
LKEEDVTMSKWEYKIIKIYPNSDNAGDDRSKALNELGEEGWEAVSVWADGSRGSCVLLKRQRAN